MFRILLYALLWLAVNVVDTTYWTSAILMSTLMVMCSGIEAAMQFWKYGVVALLSPYVVCILYLFFIAFGISNFIFLIPAYKQYFEFFIYDQFGNFDTFLRSFSHSLNYVLAGFLSLVTGYEIESKTNIVSRFTDALFKTNHILIISFEMQLWKILLLWVISLIARVYAISINIFGFTASSIAIENNLGTIQLLGYVISLSKGVLLFLGLLYFSKPQSLQIKFWLAIVMVIELFFGLLSGFKSGLFFPFMILMLANIIITKKVKIKFIVMAILSIFLAYALVEPMREASYGYQSDKKVGATELVEIATTGVKEKKITEENALPFFYVFMYRNSLGVFLSISENLVNHEHRFYPHFDTERKIIYAPILAYVPRAVWPDKPFVSNGGVLYNREILGAPDDINVSITPSTFGYILLGTHRPLLYIIGFFFLLGMLQYYIYSLYRNHGLGGIIVCVGLLLSFGILEEPQMIIVAYFRELPIFIIFQFLFLYRFSSSTKAQVALE